MESVVVVVNAELTRADDVDYIEVLEEDGFTIVDRKCLVLSQPQADAISDSLEDEAKFLEGPCVAFLLQRERAFERLKYLSRGSLDGIYFSRHPWATVRDRRLLFPARQAQLQRTVLIIKPGVSEKAAGEIEAALESLNLIVLARETRSLSTEVARELLRESKEAVEYVTSGACQVLVVEGMDCIDELRLAVGPQNPLLAQTLAPLSLRARFGQDSVKNLVYCSESAERAKSCIAALFPSPLCAERTVCIIKSQSLSDAPLILKYLELYGFTVIAQSRQDMSEERATKLYWSDMFPTAGLELSKFVKSLSSGTNLVCVLLKPSAVASLNVLLDGHSASIRAVFGGEQKGDVMLATPNEMAVDSAVAEFFPKLSVESVPSLEEIQEFMNRKEPPRPFVSLKGSLHEVLLTGLTELCRVKPVGDDAVTWLAKWLLRNNPNKPLVDEPPEPEEDGVEGDEATVFVTVNERKE